MSAFDEQLGDQRRFGFTATALPSGTFAVVDLVGTEAISRLYEFTLTLVSENRDLDFEAVLNHPATLTIYPRTDATQPVSYHGLVTHLEQAQQIGPYAVYRAQLRPHVWNLSREQMSEVYVELTTPQVIARKLQEHRLTSQDCEVRLTSSYKTWSYLCQYEETDLDFIARLMERDGIYFYFEQGPEREKLILVDSQTGQPAPVRPVSYRPAAQLETGVSEESLQTWTCRQHSVPRNVVLQDYNYRTASLPLLATAEVSPSGQGEVWRYGEGFATPQEGQALATVRAQELACRRKTFQGEGTVTGLRAGFVIAVQGHYRVDYNGRYLVTEVRHEGAQAGTLLAGLEAGGGAAGTVREDFYRSECAAIPADVQFRPERLTPKPLIPGAMTAFVDAEGSGQYAELDDQGRYKVQLPFDRTDKQAAKASAWVRKGTPYMGSGHGMHFPLHKGAEVLLSFQDGDLNRPLITSAVPNSANLSPVTSQNQTQVAIHTAGSNRLTFEDQAGSEHIHLQTPKDQTTLRMGTGLSSTVGAQVAGASTDGFTFTTGANWTVSAQDASTTLKKNTLKVTGSQEATIIGVSSEVVIGKDSKTVVGMAGDIYVGLAGNIYLAPPLSGHMCIGVWEDTYIGSYTKIIVGTENVMRFANVTEFAVSKIQTAASTIKSIGSKLETLGSKIQAAGEKIVAAASSIRSSGSSVVDEGIEMVERGMRVANTGVDVEETATAVGSSDVQVTETATGIKSGGIEMSDFGVTMLG